MRFAALCGPSPCPSQRRRGYLAGRVIGRAGAQPPGRAAPLIGVGPVSREPAPVSGAGAARERSRVVNPFSQKLRLPRRRWLFAGGLAVLFAAWGLLAFRLAGLLAGGQFDRGLASGLVGSTFALASAVVVVSLVGCALAVLRRSQRALTATIESMADAVLVVDRRGRVLEANRAALGLFGAAEVRELLVPLPSLCARWQLRAPDGSCSPAIRAFQRALCGETVRHEEALLRLSDGSERAVSLCAAPVLDEPGAPARMAVLSLQDVGEVKRLSRLRDDFLALAAHELKTPLAAVKGYAQLLRRGAVRGETAGRALEVIDRQCGRMHQLVEDLLDLSRFDVGGFELHPRPCELGALAAEALSRVRPLAPRHRLELDCEPEAAIEADAGRVVQVLENLIDNAVKFSPRGGEIRISVALEGAECVARVEDHGLGIPEQERAHVFERFYQAHPEVLSSRGGLGIGLTISREIVAQHGGRIWFESRQGEGSTFCFSLPRRAPAPLPCSCAGSLDDAARAS